ncbi:MAG: hypothetical protein UT02_C0032G0003 [Parcubacteria group bacterium GW2011_GWC2_38_7]|nr:MAG: hypothetical protein UT02_C0032G0003 [Parcubacteria group bacterium GW2011_GWC2_38_7]
MMRKYYSVILVFVLLLSGCAKIYINKGIGYAKQGEYDQAILNFNKALEINPKHAEAYINRGNAYFFKGQHNEAIKDFNKAIEIEPGNAEAYISRGNIYSAKSEYDEAIADLNRALEVNLRYARIYNDLKNDLGLNSFLLKDYWQYYYDRKSAYAMDMAQLRALQFGKFKYRYIGPFPPGEKEISEFNKVLEINIKLAMAYHNKGLNREQAGKTQEALDSYKEFIQFTNFLPPQYDSQVNYVKQRIRDLERK